MLTGRRSKFFPIYIFLDFLFVLLNLSSLENIISTIRYKSYWKTTTCSLKKIFSQYFVTMKVCLGTINFAVFEKKFQILLTAVCFCWFNPVCTNFSLYFDIIISSITAQKTKVFLSKYEQMFSTDLFTLLHNAGKDWNNGEHW